MKQQTRIKEIKGLKKELQKTIRDRRAAVGTSSRGHPEPYNPNPNPDPDWLSPCKTLMAVTL